MGKLKLKTKSKIKFINKQKEIEALSLLTNEESNSEIHLQF